MQYFTIISGVASILGFILTVANIFPTQTKVRNYITIFAIGSFIGSFVGSIKNININFPTNPLGTGILLFYILSLIGLFAIVLAAIFSNDKEKRSEFLSIVGDGFGLLVFVGMFILLFSGIFMGATEDAKSAVSLDELLVLSDANVNKGNLDRAMKQLEMFSNRCASDDPRKEATVKKIEELKNQQSKAISNK